ncbi:MAG TPA: hypothetical protein VFZ16_03220 [Hyphomicrobiaceae bacterium]|nr:hypothetical protein [Hyphomicrobiaceae bacterium]
MQLAPMRFTKIDGTAVAVSVRSAAEAKAAVKELRHKKRELKFLRAALVRRLRSVRPKRSRRRVEQSALRQTLSGIGWLVGTLVDVATVSGEERRARNPDEMEREIHNIDETLHNIEGCILQLQGKLLTLG